MAIQFPLLKDPKKIKNGEALWAAGHVFNVREIWKADAVEIVTHVVRQTSVISDPYWVTLALDEQRNVVRGRCSCQAGTDANCKHGSAVMTYVNNESHESKTDELSAWVGPS